MAASVREAEVASVRELEAKSIPTKTNLPYAS